MTAQDALRKQRRILRYLRLGEAGLEPAADGVCVLLKRGDQAAIAAAQEDVQRLEEAALLKRMAGGRLTLSQRGLQALQAMENEGDRMRARHRDIAEETILNDDGAWVKVAVNQAESPLAGLARRRTRSGAPFLTREEYEAGERLRADYDRGRFMACTGVNWEAAGSGAGKRRAANRQADLTDMAMAARARVDAAIDAVGPELAGILIDICCFLKGLERTERERHWPARSAKIMLKNALAALARHYFPPPRRQAGHGRILHWGTDGYRPTI